MPKTLLQKNPDYYYNREDDDDNDMTSQLSTLNPQRLTISLQLNLMSHSFAKVFPTISHSRFSSSYRFSDSTIKNATALIGHQSRRRRRKALNLSVPMASERDNFHISGPSHLTAVDWSNPDHRRSVAACLVKGVYVLEKDRQEGREFTQAALAPPWWETFHFQPYRLLIDDTDSCLFGAIYQHTSLPLDGNHSPRFVIAFRGTITSGDALFWDAELNFQLIRNALHQTSRFEMANQAVRHVVATFGSANVWLAGHSLGSAMAMLAGKHMAKTGVFLESFLFNPPFFSPPFERIKNKAVKHGIRIAGSVITAGLALAMKKNHQTNRADPFVTLASWFPSLFVNRADHICSEYIGYFEHRKKMEHIGAGDIERLATQHSLQGLLLNAVGQQQSEEPLHLIPSASLTVNLSRARCFKDAHSINQWWRPDLHLESKFYTYT